MAARLSPLDAVIFSAGILVILSATSFLAFLWFGDSSNSVWLAIVLNGWLIRAVTILSLAIRAAVGLNLTLCVSMLAALTIEHGQTPLPSAAAISMMRFQNSGPMGLLSRLRPAMRNPRGLALVVTTSLLAITAICLQFASTALLSDVASDFIKVPSDKSELPYAQNLDGNKTSVLASSRVEQSGGYVHSKPTFPLFAEYAESSRKSRDGLFDTGMSMRAFLPIASQNQRILLRDYAGPSTIFDTRVVCVRPDPGLSTFRWRYVIPPRPDQIPPGFSSSTVLPSIEPSFEGYAASSSTTTRFYGKPGMTFNCTFATPQFSDGDWPVSLCTAGPSSKGKLVSAMEPFPPITANGEGAGGRQEIFLLINTTGLVEDWGSFNLTQKMAEEWNGQWIDFPSHEVDGEWLHLRPNIATLGFSVSLCYTAVDAMNAVIHATTTAGNISEPTVPWVASGQKFDAREAHQQLGSSDDTDSPEDRGVFRLSPLESWLGYNATDSKSVPFYIRNDTVEPSTLSMFVNPLQFLPFTMALCSTCDCVFCGFSWQNTTKLQATQAAVVNEMLRVTRSAAKGVQALITVLSAQMYYDNLDFFDVAAPANMTSYVPVLRPVRKAFFTVIMVLLGLHLILVLATVTVFLATTEYTLLGNAWYVISQFRGKDVESWQGKQLIGDAEVERCMEAQGISRTLVGVEKSSNRVSIKKHV